MKKERDAILVLAIERSMKRHIDNVMNVLEGVNARLVQLENKTSQIETSIDNLKASVGNSHAELKQIDNTIKEVHTRVQVIKDKHETLETQLQLSNLQISNTSLSSAPSFHHTNPFPHDINPISQHDSYYQPFAQRYQPPPPSSPPQYSQIPPLHQHYDELPYQQYPSFAPDTFLRLALPELGEPYSSSNMSQSSAPQMPEPLPSGSEVSGASGSSSSNNENMVIPNDDAVGKVASMGFPRDKVKAMVKKLTKNEQTVDLNVVLDKLMADGIGR